MNVDFEVEKSSKYLSHEVCLINNLRHVVTKFVIWGIRTSCSTIRQSKMVSREVNKFKLQIQMETPIAVRNIVLDEVSKYGMKKVLQRDQNQQSLKDFKKQRGEFQKTDKESTEKTDGLLVKLKRLLTQFLNQRPNQSIKQPQENKIVDDGTMKKATEENNTKTEEVRRETEADYDAKIRTELPKQGFDEGTPVNKNIATKATLNDTEKCTKTHASEQPNKAEEAKGKREDEAQLKAKDTKEKTEEESKLKADNAEGEKEEDPKVKAENVKGKTGNEAKLTEKDTKTKTAEESKFKAEVAEGQTEEESKFKAENVKQETKNEAKFKKEDTKGKTEEKAQLKAEIVEGKIEEEAKLKAEDADGAEGKIEEESKLKTEAAKNKTGETDTKKDKRRAEQGCGITKVAHNEALYTAEEKGQNKAAHINKGEEPVKEARKSVADQIQITSQEQRNTLESDRKAHEIRTNNLDVKTNLATKNEIAGTSEHAEEVNKITEKIIEKISFIIKDAVISAIQETVNADSEAKSISKEKIEDTANAAAHAVDEVVANEIEALNALYSETKLSTESNDEASCHINQNSTDISKLNRLTDAVFKICMELLNAESSITKLLVKDDLEQFWIIKEKLLSSEVWLMEHEKNCIQPKEYYTDFRNQFQQSLIVLGEACYDVATNRTQNESTQEKRKKTMFHFYLPAVIGTFEKQLSVTNEMQFFQRILNHLNHSFENNIKVT